MTILAFHAVRIAGKPADEEHNYGHGKVETVAALVETGFLLRPRGFHADRGRAAGSMDGSIRVEANALGFRAC